MTRFGKSSTVSGVLDVAVATRGTDRANTRLRSDSYRDELANVAVAARGTDRANTTLRSDSYRDELANIAADTHDDTGPQPTVQEIEAVLADLDAPGRG